MDDEEDADKIGREQRKRKRIKALLNFQLLNLVLNLKFICLSFI